MLDTPIYSAAENPLHNLDDDELTALEVVLSRMLDRSGMNHEFRLITYPAFRTVQDELNRRTLKELMEQYPEIFPNA
jgi:hypothetical protein